MKSEDPLLRSPDPPRSHLLERLGARGHEQYFDLVVVGGGITGAGIFREAARRGIRVLLVEKSDFAGGTSSCSSKMVRGSLGMPGAGSLRRSRQVLQEKDMLLEKAPGLVRPLSCAFSRYEGEMLKGWRLHVSLQARGLLAGRRISRMYGPADWRMMVPGLPEERLRGGVLYEDAVTDDARLVLQVIATGRRDGGLALNYTRVCGLMRDSRGYVRGVYLQAGDQQGITQVRTAVVVDATGFGGLSAPAGEPPVYNRPLRRGSHLILPAWRLPVAHGISLEEPGHPRPVMVFPWEGVTVVGCSETDHDGSPDAPPAITTGESDRLLEMVNRHFPGPGLSEADLIGSWSALWPDLPGDTRSRLREDKGLVTVGGANLTDFRLVAIRVLQRAAPGLRGFSLADHREPIAETDPPQGERPGAWSGREGLVSACHGGRVGRWLAGAAAHLRRPFPGTVVLRGEVVIAAHDRDVQHLDDLLLRRTRLGLVLADGGLSLRAELEQLCRLPLGWNRSRWRQEWQRYSVIRAGLFGVPGQGPCPPPPEPPPLPPELATPRPEFLGLS